jgi:DUF4097 and DUF4098 domain-containing protein YvlB
MEHIRTVEREFATGARAVLHLESRSGSVRVEGRDTEKVSVVAELHFWSDLAAEADDAAALVERGMEQDGHRVIVRAPSLTSGQGRGLLFHLGLKGSRVDYTVQVPVQTAARVLSRSGSVQITHLEGVVHTEALSGKVNVDDVQGDVRAVSRSGNVQLERIGGNVAAEARSGRLRIQQIEGAVEAEARSGSLEIDQVSGRVRVAAQSGSLTLERCGSTVQARTKAGSVRFRGRVEGDMAIEAHAGSITFAADPATPFFIDAESHFGSVRSDLAPRTGRNGPPEAGPRVKLRSHAGSIRVTRAEWTSAG